MDDKKDAANDSGRPPTEKLAREDDDGDLDGQEEANGQEDGDGDSRNKKGSKIETEEDDDVKLNSGDSDDKGMDSSAASRQSGTRASPRRRKPREDLGFFVQPHANKNRPRRRKPTDGASLVGPSPSENPEDSTSTETKPISKSGKEKPKNKDGTAPNEKEEATESDFDSNASDGRKRSLSNMDPSREREFNDTHATPGDSAVTPTAKSPRTESSGDTIPSSENKGDTNAIQKDSSGTRKRTLRESSSSRDVTNTMEPEITTSSPKTTNRSNKKAKKTSNKKNTKQRKGGTTSVPPLTQKIVDKEFSTCWICCECREAECMMQPDADTLMICEGTCRRLFHYPCAGLPRLPDEFVCGDCRMNRFTCAICQNYGEGNVDVFRCNVARCGLFYHQACLVLREIPFTLVDTMDDESGDSVAGEGERLLRPEFKCPSHKCWTCSWEVTNKEGVSDHDHKGRKGKSKKDRALFERRTGELMRCLQCPIAYHLSCIPPAARFHELALLCHEHALTHKLPELDAEHSIQSILEAKMDQKFKFMGNSQMKFRQSINEPGKTHNKFFGGLSGDTITKSESDLLKELLGLVQNRDTDGDEELEHKTGLLPFCLPCEIKNDVYSKPPSYKHVHTLRYNPSNRPPRLPMSGEICQCVDYCGEDCFNRMLYVECVGELGHKNSNCALGKECGNRRLGRRQFVKCKPLPEQGRGWGLVTCESVKAGDLVTEYVGEVIDARTKEQRLVQWTRDHPNDPNFYVMSLQNGWYIDAREVANLSRFINHSCQPNCRLTTFNVDGYMRNGIFALVDIEPGEFLSYDYRFDSRQDNDNKFVCRCGAPKCRGTMKTKEKKYGLGLPSLLPGDLVLQRTSNGEDSLKAAKDILAKEQAFLEEVETRRRERLSQVDIMVPAATNADESVANGAQKRYRSKYTPKLFLWRNASIGSDWERRLSKLRNRS